jgi:hypothetical protein
MATDTPHVKSLVAGELALIADPTRRTALHAVLREPVMEMRDWDYGPPGGQFPCWIVTVASERGVVIGYCEQGFGPRCPWGLLWTDAQTSMGMDCGWFSSLADAFADYAE